MRKTAVVAAAALLLLIPFPAQGAGIGAHAEMGQRAWDQYLIHEDAILPGIAAFRADDEVMRAFYSGCCFPDFAYEGINQDASEYSHWYPYINAYLEYLRDNYPPPWDQDAMKHIAFFFGLLCHDAGDWPWHFNEGENKSLTAAFVDHYGSDEADYASDIFAHTLFTIRPSIKGHFWWPRDEAYKIFVIQEVKVTQDEVDRGCRRLEGEWRKGATFGPIVYPVFQWKYPWMRAHMDDYYFGGIDHGAALVAQCIRYAYAKLHGWDFYENISLREILFPDKKPFLPMQPPLEVLRPIGKSGLEKAGDASMLRIDLSDWDSEDEVREATLWLYEKPGAAASKVALYCGGNDTISPVEESELGPGWKHWDIKTFVKQWVSAPETNKGIILINNGESYQEFDGPTMKIYATEYGGRLVGMRPILVVK